MMISIIVFNETNEQGNAAGVPLLIPLGDSISLNSYIVIPTCKLNETNI
jgi:hypothetical protein